MELIEYLSKSDNLITTIMKCRLFNKKIYTTKSDIIQSYLKLFNHNTKMWGRGIYSPKWTSTFYTLRDLMQLAINPNNNIFQMGIDTLINNIWYKNHTVKNDICVIAMMVSLLTYGKREKEIVDEMMMFLLKHHQKDGGWNCASLTHKTDKSSINTTITVLEALRDYINRGYINNTSKLKTYIKSGQEYLLRKKLYKSETSNTPIKDYMTKIHFPIRWQYDLFRGLEYLASINYQKDKRMSEALDILKKSFKNGLLPKGPTFPGKLHFKYDLEVYKKINTIRGLSILKVYDNEYYQKLIKTEI
ncbi:MAG: hypothetical protein ACOCUD_02460 [Bacillota bacterium]